MVARSAISRSSFCMALWCSTLWFRLDCKLHICPKEINRPGSHNRIGSSLPLSFSLKCRRLASPSIWFHISLWAHLSTRLYSHPSSLSMHLSIHVFHCFFASFCISPSCGRSWLLLVHNTISVFHQVPSEKKWGDLGTQSEASLVILWSLFVIMRIVRSCLDVCSHALWPLEL